MVERRPMSVSQFSELVGIEPAQFIGVEVDRITSTVVLVVEGATMQTTATFPEVSSNKGYGKGKGSAKTPTKGGPKKH